MPIQTISSRAQVLARMTAGTGQTIPADAQVVRTANGYWVAWFDQQAAVLPPGVPPEQGCDWVEGCAGLEELIQLIESGEYAAMEDFEGSDAEWEALEEDLENRRHHD